MHRFLSEIGTVRAEDQRKELFGPANASAEAGNHIQASKIDTKPDKKDE